METNGNPPSKKDEGVRGFDVLLREIDDGTVHSDLGKEMHRLTGELYELALNHSGGKAVKGSLTLKIDVIASANGSVVLHADVGIKVPKPRRMPSVMFITKGGNLTVENPRQQKLPLREVPAQQKDVRDVAAAEQPARSV